MGAMGYYLVECSQCKLTFGPVGILITEEPGGTRREIEAAQVSISKTHPFHRYNGLAICRYFGERPALREERPALREEP